MLYVVCCMLHAACCILKSPHLGHDKVRVDQDRRVVLSQRLVDPSREGPTTHADATHRTAIPPHTHTHTRTHPIPSMAVARSGAEGSTSTARRRLRPRRARSTDLPGRRPARPGGCRRLRTADGSFAETSRADEQCWPSAGAQWHCPTAGMTGMRTRADVDGEVSHRSPGAADEVQHFADQQSPHRR